jgi:hypothetical protein
LLAISIFGELEQWIALGKLAQLGGQLQLRQLQKPDGLLQLRRESQLLIKTELKPWFHACRNGGRGFILTLRRNADHTCHGRNGRPSMQM